MIRLEIPLYVRKIQVRKSRKPKYLTPTSKIPKKYSDKTQYAFSKGVLVSRSTGLPVITNAASLTKPEFLYVNGQLFYQGINEHTRMLIVETVKRHMTPFVKTLPSLAGPLRIHTELHCPVGQANWDVDNLWIYNKCFQDLLKPLQKLPDDNIRHITCAGGIESVP
jgi:hypothetical protein